MRDWNRRELVALAAAALPLRGVLRAVAAAPRADHELVRVRPFELARVRLAPGPFLDAARVNARFLLALDPDRLLHTFRRTAGLPSSAEPLGGWESPDNELRGHFTGHYLSACAYAWASLGDGALKERGDRMVEELGACQRALGSGYLSAFPEELFDRLREGRQVWAPFYTLHKIVAGLLDMHVLAGNPRALAMAEGIAGWIGRWVAPLGDAAMAHVLEREYGGMNEALYNLAALTGKEAYRSLAHRFDHERVFAPLAGGRDELKGLHANTTVPKVIGAARRHELTGERRARDVAEFFWREVISRRMYCTGGTSNGESWNAEPGVVAGELSGYTQESCVTYNLLKLTRHVFGWTADPACAEYVERALFNGILPTQHPADGSKLYYLPLESGYWKLFGTPLHDFWCCTGTGSESFARLSEQIYFHAGDELYVNQFVASELDWGEKATRIRQDTRFPAEDATRLEVSCERPTRFTLRLRIPSWAPPGSAVALNGRRLEGSSAPGGYLLLARTWRKGDRIELSLPLRVREEATPDDARVRAFLYGPLVLAGRLGKEGLTAATLRAEPTRPRTVPEYKTGPVAAPAVTGLPGPVRGEPLEFRAAGAGGREIVLAPLDSIFDERYAVYWSG